MAIDFKKLVKGLIIRHETDQSKQLKVQVNSSATTGTMTTVEAAQTANITVTLPNSTTTLTGTLDVATLTNKTINADLNTITNIDNNEIKANAGIDASKIADGSVSNAEYQYIQNVTSDIQTQLNQAGTNLTNHINNPTDAHDASAISTIPVGNLAATDVQGAVNELQTDIDTRALTSALTAHTGASTGVHGVSGAVVGTTDAQTLTTKTIVVANNIITTAASGNLGSTELNAALSELQLDVDSRSLNSALTAHISNTTTHGTIGNIVGTSDTQTLTNKTIAYSANTITGVVPTSTLTTKGDIFVATGASTIVRKAAGADGTFLRADSLQSDGLAWASVSGSASSVVTKTTNYTATTSDDVILCNVTTAFTITLYTAVGNSGKILTFKKTTNNFVEVTIDPNSSETIDGLSTTTLNSVNEVVKIISDGTNWQMLERKFDQSIHTYTPASTGGSGTYRRVANGLEIHIYQPLAGGLGGTYAPEIPTGLFIATADLVGNNPALGIAWAITAASNQRWTGTVIYLSTTTVGILGPSSGGPWGPGIPAAFNAADEINTKFWIPITGWKGN